LRYKYDSAEFNVQDGQIYVNGSTWSWTENNRWELIITQEELGNRTYTVTSITDDTYGITLLLNSAGSLQVTNLGEWTTTMRLTMGEKYADVYLGATGPTTNDFDEEYDILLPPLPPGYGSVEAYFWDPDNPTTPLDYRKLTTSYSALDYPAIWTLKAQAIGVTDEITLTWNETEIQYIPGAFSVMLDTPSGGINMRFRDSYTWTAEADTIYLFNLTVSTQSDTTLILKSGWNLVSLPKQPENNSAAAVLSSVDYYALFSWTGSSYEAATSFEPGVGYWLFVTEDVNIPVTGDSLVSVSLYLSPGWNIIGGPNGAVNAGGLSSEYYYICTWDGSGYVEASIIEPGKGYWIAVAKDLEIQLTG